MSKVRINDLASELEVKSRPILDALEAIGVSGKTHSSSIEADQAERVRDYFNNPGARSSQRPAAPKAEPAFNLGNISKPGDAMRAILERKNAENAARNAPPKAQRPVAVRHYFGQYEEGEERPVPIATLETPTDTPETSSMSKTPEEIIAAEKGLTDAPEEITDVSTEDIADVEDAESDFDGFSDADNRESQIELDNDSIDELDNDSQEVSDETADIAETTDGHDRG